MSAVDGHALDYLSHSRLAAYRACSLKFRFQYVDKRKSAFTPSALAFGIAFHKAVEVALLARMTGATPALSELLAVFGTAMDEQAQVAPIKCGAHETPASMVEQAERMLAAWLAWPRPSAKILAVEHEFKIPIASWLPPLMGRIDLVEELDDGSIAVVDVKTSRSRWGHDDLEEHAGQLALYRAAVATLASELGKPIRVGFEVVTKAKNPVVERLYFEGEGESLDRQVKIAALVLEGIERNVFIPSPGWSCATCPYSEVCRDW